MSDQELISRIAAYWDTHLHDEEITTEPAGTAGYFRQLDEYRYEKLTYLPRLVQFSDYSGKALLEVGCGAGIDLARFAQAGAQVTGIDLARTAIELAGQNFSLQGLQGELAVMNGEKLRFPADRFDAAYAHGVLQYTADARKMLAEIHRVLKPGGQAVLMVYNKYSWLNLVSKITRVPLEHEDAPVYRKFSTGEFKELLSPFKSYRIIGERFPVRTRLHRGAKARVYNDVFVRAFELVPTPLIRPFGWHLMAFADK